MARPLLVLCALLAVGSLASAQDGHHDEPPPVQQGGSAPAFGPVPVLNAKAAGTSTVSFATGPADVHHAWIISFMAGWCPGCVNELPMLAKLDGAYRDRGVQVLGVSIDDKAKAAVVQKILSEANVHFPVAVDADHKVIQQYQGLHRTSLPFLMVIDKTGVVRLLDEGYSEATESQVRAVLDSLLAR